MRRINFGKIVAYGKSGIAGFSVIELSNLCLSRFFLNDVGGTSAAWLDVAKFMVNGLFSQANYQGLKKMLDVTVMRHEAIASNLANLETPNYKRIDVDANFGAELNRAIQSGKVNEVSRMQARLVIDKNAPAPNRDGNTVQLDNELMHLQQNGIAHTMQTQFITGAMMKLRSAIQGRSV